MPFSARRRSFTWIALLLAAAAGLVGWWRLGRPVTLPDAPSSRIACVSYAPYHRAGQSPFDPAAFITPAQIDADLAALSRRFDCVRTYSQGQGLAAVPGIAARHGMQVLMGIWLGRDAAANAKEVASGIAIARADPGALRGVIVGNEVLLRGELAPSVLADYLHQVRASVPSSVPVSYADVWETWLRYPRMAAAVDVLTIHILPYWEDRPVPPEHAVGHVANVYARISRAFPGRRVMIGETGWPSAGRPRRGARPSRVNEARYLRGFLRFAAAEHVPYNVIEAFDQPWKRTQEGTVGGYWGIFDAHARPKFPMQGPVVEAPRWWLGWLAGGVGVALFVLVLGRRRPWPGVAALALAGVATGTALAWQLRQMAFACRDGLEWSVSALACLAALATAMGLAQALAERLAGGHARWHAPTWLRLGWLFALAWLDLLLVFDGRYRDFPLGLFAAPCIGYALLAGLGKPAERVRLEARALALVSIALALALVVQEAALDATAWLWLGLNLALGGPVLLAGLRAQQA